MSVSADVLYVTVASHVTRAGMGGDGVPFSVEDRGYEELLAYRLGYQILRRGRILHVNPLDPGWLATPVRTVVHERLLVR
jgi:hypothetical protein